MCSYAAVMHTAQGLQNVGNTCLPRGKLGKPAAIPTGWRNYSPVLRLYVIKCKTGILARCETPRMHSPLCGGYAELLAKKKGGKAVMPYRPMPTVHRGAWLSGMDKSIFFANPKNPVA